LAAAYFDFLSRQCRSIDVPHCVRGSKTGAPDAAPSSARDIDPAHDQPIAHFVKCRGSRGRIAGEQSNHLAWSMQVLLNRGGPMDVWVKQAFQSGPIAALDRGENITDRWYLLRHG
jgi:hypothetical protein